MATTGKFDNAVVEWQKSDRGKRVIRQYSDIVERINSVQSLIVNRYGASAAYWNAQMLIDAIVYYLVHRDMDGVFNIPDTPDFKNYFGTFVKGKKKSLEGKRYMPSQNDILRYLFIVFEVVSI